MSRSIFVIVGHTNRGKTSVVSTLSEDENPRIAPQPGTTTESRSFELMGADQQPLVTFIDTPGFENARRLRDWVEQRRQGGDQRQPRAMLAQFIAENSDVDQYRNECRLLEPVLEGAMIVYVIDPSRPVQEAARAEMEILRWTGQPRIALINPIEQTQYERAWRSELRQHFQQIRVFNAHQAVFQQRIELLRGLGEIDDEIKPRLEKVVDALTHRRAVQQQQSARCIAGAIEKMLLARETKRLSADANLDRHKQALKETLLKHIREFERECQSEIKRVYRHQKLTVEQQELTGAQLGEDLFSKQTWTRFGLNRAQLATTGAATGAAAGGVIDVSVGGASFFLGMVLGGLVGGAASWYGVNQLMRVTVLKQPLGGYALSVRLMHPNFPWVALDRLAAYHALIADHPHARRGTFVLVFPRAQGLAQHLSKPTRKRMQKCFDMIKGIGSAEDAREELAELIDAHMLQSP